jgi:hypothetical protein
MRQTLILHIGTHKTGSTTIQNYLYYNRLWLRHLGVFYPRPLNGRLFYTSNHSDLRDTALSEGKQRGAQIHPQFGSHDALLGRYIRTIKEVRRPLNILSAEGWSSHLNRYARRLAPLTQHFDVKVIVFMRRPDYWIEKFYNALQTLNILKSGHLSGFWTNPILKPICSIGTACLAGGPTRLALRI